MNYSFLHETIGTKTVEIRRTKKTHFMHLLQHKQAGEAVSAVLKVSPKKGQQRQKKDSKCQFSLPLLHRYMSPEQGLCSETLQNFICQINSHPLQTFPKILVYVAYIPIQTLKKKPNLINMWPLRIHSKRFLLFISVPFFPDVPSTYLFFLFHFPPFFT